MTMVGPCYMDKIYNCREVSEIDIFDITLSKICIDWDYKNERILVRTQNGWTFLDSNLTVAQVIKIIGYDQYFIQVIWSRADILTNVLDTSVKDSSLSIIRIYKN
jgi:hypothetical protein